MKSVIDVPENLYYALQDSMEDSRRTLPLSVYEYMIVTGTPLNYEEDMGMALETISYYKPYYQYKGNPAPHNYTR